MRIDGRAKDQLRSLSIEVGVQEFAEGSALISCGRTRVLCAASVDDKVPDWLLGSGRGWVTGEYSMLPRATNTRHARERTTLSGRTQEIQRLIGRALRASLDLSALGERMITVDCDVLQADGGTRTASVTGGYVAMALAVQGLIRNGKVTSTVWAEPVAAVSVGIVDGRALLDLDYAEDSRAEVDFNVVMNGARQFVEVQGTAEGNPFSEDRLAELIGLARTGIEDLLALQGRVLRADAL